MFYKNTFSKFSNEFTSFLDKQFDEKGEAVFDILGISPKQLDPSVFSTTFFGSDSIESIADISIDDNANVRDINISTFPTELSKPHSKIFSIYLLFDQIAKDFSLEKAEKAIEGIIDGSIFCNDLHRTYTSYCYAFELRNLMHEGMPFFNSSFNIKPPKHTQSFLNLVIQSVSYISNQITGAASFPDFFLIYDHFLAKDHGEDYIKNLTAFPENPSTFEKLIRNQFQNIIYSFNFPFRGGGQSAFVNLSVLDRGFLKNLFTAEGVLKSAYILPDGTAPNLERTLELSKRFLEYYDEINLNEGVFTFPVMTIALSKDDKGNYQDIETVEWASEVNRKKGVCNVYLGSPDSFSSCCRLKNDFSKLGSAGFQNSFGVGGLSIGSHRVAGVNLPRLAFAKNIDEELNSLLDSVHHILYSHRSILKRHIGKGLLPLYKHHWISLKNQYGTIGFVGLYEHLVNRNIEPSSEDGVTEGIRLMNIIEDKIAKMQETDSHIYNLEQIPAESMAVRLAKLDTYFGFNPNKYVMYSNQYIPLTEDAAIYDRLRVQGVYDEHTSGGAISHINISDKSELTAIQFRKIIDTMRVTGAQYMGVNYPLSKCANSHFTKTSGDMCPICGEKIVEAYSRVVGFMTPVSSWNKTRKSWEFPRRVFKKEIDAGHGDKGGEQ